MCSVPVLLVGEYVEVVKRRKSPTSTARHCCCERVQEPADRVRVISIPGMEGIAGEEGGRWI